LAGLERGHDHALIADLCLALHLPLQCLLAGDAGQPFPLAQCRHCRFFLHQLQYLAVFIADEVLLREFDVLLLDCQFGVEPFPTTHLRQQFPHVGSNLLAVSLLELLDGEVVAADLHHQVEGVQLASALEKNKGKPLLQSGLFGEIDQVGLALVQLHLHLEVLPQLLGRTLSAQVLHLGHPHRHSFLLVLH
jgi:hypothetical protein